MLNFRKSRRVQYSRKHLISLLLMAFSIVYFNSCRHDAVVPLQQVCFQTEVLPVLISNCTSSGCHGINGDNDIIINSYASIMQSGTVVTGKPFKSSLYNSIRATNKMCSQHPMPPNYRLNDDQIKYIYVWILQGANNTSCHYVCDTCVTPPPCDSTNVKYNPTIANIISIYCYSCHNSNSDDARQLNSYQAVVDIAQSGELKRDVIDRRGENPMPPAGPLGNCQIAQIKNWLNNGTPQNK